MGTGPHQLGKKTCDHSWSSSAAVKFTSLLLPATLYPTCLNSVLCVFEGGVGSNYVKDVSSQSWEKQKEEPKSAALRKLFSNPAETHTVGQYTATKVKRCYRTDIVKIT